MTAYMVPLLALLVVALAAIIVLWNEEDNWPDGMA